MSASIAQQKLSVYRIDDDCCAMMIELMHRSSNYLSYCFLMTSFFVSYNSADSAWAEWIAWILEEAGHETIIQAWDFRPGGNFVMYMQRAAAETDKTVLVLSEDYLKAEFTQSEWAAAFADDATGLKRKLIPIRVRQCKPRGVLRPIVYVDVVGLEQEVARQAILSALPERVKPTSAPPFPMVGKDKSANRVVPEFPDHSQFEETAPIPDDIPVDLPVLNSMLVGRKNELDQVHLALQDHGRVAMTGMPGVGKSLLALQYADSCIQAYPGGVFWIEAGQEDSSADGIALQIVELAISEGVTVPETIPIPRQLRHCAKNWPRAPYPVLLVVDNASSMNTLGLCLKWLPPERFKLLITTRSQADCQHSHSVECVRVMPLKGEATLDLFRAVLPDGDPRLEEEQAALLQLSNDILGGLPLALQVVATSLARKPHLSVSAFNENLRSTRGLLQGNILTDVEMAGMLDRTKQGVVAAFEFSWQSLAEEAQILGALISLFAPSPLPWPLVLEAAQGIPDLKNPAVACSNLQQMSLLRQTDEKLGQYQMHRLLRSFFRVKAEEFQVWTQ
ncbi:MAG: TIR domain-containing protein [Elainellaceae cyanobacterium]